MRIGRGEGSTFNSNTLTSICQVVNDPLEEKVTDIQLAQFCNGGVMGYTLSNAF